MRFECIYYSLNSTRWLSVPITLCNIFVQYPGLDNLSMTKKFSYIYGRSMGGSEKLILDLND